LILKNLGRYFGVQGRKGQWGVNAIIGQQLGTHIIQYLPAINEIERALGGAEQAGKAEQQKKENNERPAPSIVLILVLGVVPSI
jgi:hypothetical protein